MFDHPEAVDICRSIVDSGGEFTVSSVRLETVTPEIARLMIAGGQRTLTIAPEAGSDRLRRVINKSCTDGEILSAISAAREAGFARMKLYFMIGLPTETDDDITAIVDLARRLSREFPAMQFQISGGSFVPKPWTPFQWHPMERESVLKKRYARLRAGISSIKNAQFGGDGPRLAVVQGCLARGDRRLGAMLIEAVRNGGYYSAALRATGVDPAQYIYRERPEDELLPWDHLDMLVDKGYLLDEYKKALREETSAPCSVGDCGSVARVNETMRHPNLKTTNRILLCQAGVPDGVTVGWAWPRTELNNRATRVIIRGIIRSYRQNGQRIYTYIPRYSITLMMASRSRFLICRGVSVCSHR